MTKFAVLTLVFVSSFAHAGYQECVLGNLESIRRANPCSFDELQTQLRQSNTQCRNVYIQKMLEAQGPDDMKALNAQIPVEKAATDKASQDYLQAQLLQCGFEGSVKVANGGLNLQVTIIKTK